MYLTGVNKTSKKAVIVKKVAFYASFGIRLGLIGIRIDYDYVRSLG